jgi:hypothetical protein
MVSPVRDFEYEFVSETPPQTEDARILIEFLLRELQRLGNIVNAGKVGHVKFLDVAPPRVYEGLIAAADGTNWNPGHGEGVYAYYNSRWNPMSHPAVYPLKGALVSGAGTAGTDNTAMTLQTIVVPANTLRQVGDRIRVRAYWRGDTGGAIQGQVDLNTVPISHTTDGGGATLQINESWLHYIDNTHANNIEVESGTLGNLSAANVAGFSWNTNQNLTFSQNAIPVNHCVIYFFAADVFPKGT